MQEKIYFMQNFYPFIIFCCTAIFICIFMIIIGYFLGGRSYGLSKHCQFESGIPTYGNTKIRFSMNFYIISVIFGIFDIESIYLYSWSISIRETRWLGFIEIITFIILLLTSIIYIKRIGVFNFIHNKYNK